MDIEPVAVAHSELLLAGDPNAVVQLADVRDPDSVLNAELTRKFLDFDQPVAVLIADPERGFCYAAVACKP